MNALRTRRAMRTATPVTVHGNAGGVAAATAGLPTRSWVDPPVSA